MKYLPGTKRYWVSSLICTVQCNVGLDGRIIWTAPITARFTGQSLAQLVSWLRRRSGGMQVLVEEL